MSRLFRRNFDPSVKKQASEKEALLEVKIEPKQTMKTDLPDWEPAK